MIEKQRNEKISTPHTRIYTHNKKKLELVSYYYGFMIHLLFSHHQNGWNCDIKKFKQTCNISKYQTNRESEQLPNVMNMT